MKTAVRIRKITTIAQLRGQTIHAQREDETARKRLRPGAEAGAGYAWSKAGEDGPEARDYVVALKAHKAETGAGERKGAPLALQMLVVVSPSGSRRRAICMTRAMRATRPSMRPPRAGRKAGPAKAL